jgi:hypothetical protein
MDALDENFTEFTGNYVAQYNKALASLEILMRGDVRDLLLYNPGAKARVLTIGSFNVFFQECLARYDLVYHTQGDIIGFKAFVGTEDEVFLYFGMEKVKETGYEVTLFGTVLEKAGKVASVLRRKWRSLGDSLYNAVHDYLKGPVVLEGAAGAAGAAAAPENGGLVGISKVRKQRLTNLRNAPRNSAFMGGPPDLAPQHEPEYSNNEHIELPRFNELSLKSRLTNVESEVVHRFAIATKEHKYDHVSDVNDVLLAPKDRGDILNDVLRLSNNNFMCGGISLGYIPHSIQNADIVLVIVEWDAAGVEDYSYNAGFATLKVKPTALEIDLICTNIGYKHGGLLLMDKVFKIAQILGIEKVELKSVTNKATLDFYKRLGFKKVSAENNFAKETKGGLIPYRRRITRRANGAAGAAAAGAGAAAAANKAKNAKKNTKKNRKPSTQEMYNKQNSLWNK